MATTVTAADCTVTITESYSLNGVNYGNTMSKTFASKGQVLQRVMNVSTSDPAIINFGAADAAGQVRVDDYAYFRITNLDDTNFIKLTLYNGADSFFYKLNAGDTFLLMDQIFFLQCFFCYVLRFFVTMYLILLLLVLPAALSMM